LRSNPVARIFRWEVQAILATEVAHTAGSVDQELIGSTGTPCVQAIADAIAPGHIALLALALGTRQKLQGAARCLLDLVGYAKDVTRWTGARSV